MDPNTISSLGLVSDIIGAIILTFTGVSFNPDDADHYVQVTLKPEVVRRNKLKKRFALVAVILVILGFILQLIGTNPQWLSK